MIKSYTKWIVAAIIGMQLVAASARADDAAEYRGVEKAN